MQASAGGRAPHPGGPRRPLADTKGHKAVEWRAEAGDVSRGELSGRPKWMRHAGQENRKRKLRPRTRRGAQWGRRGRLGPEPRKVRGVASAGSVKGRGELERKGETRGVTANGGQEPCTCRVTLSRMTVVTAAHFMNVLKALRTFEG